jgi:hypothetical protein
LLVAERLYFTPFLLVAVSSSSHRIRELAEKLRIVPRELSDPVLHFPLQSPYLVLSFGCDVRKSHELRAVLRERLQHAHALFCFYQAMFDVWSPFLSPAEVRELLDISQSSTTVWTTIRDSFRQIGPLQAHELAAPIRRWLAGRAAYGAYLMRYGIGAHKVPHKDPPLAPDLTGDRIVIMVQLAKLGGEFIIDGEIVPLSPGDAVFFRSDLSLHSISPVLLGERVILSVGFGRDRPSGS